MPKTVFPSLYLRLSAYQRAGLAFPYSRIEIEIEGVDRAISVVVNDDSTADGTLGLALGIRSDPFEPVGLRASINTLFRRQKDAGVSKRVETVEVV